MTNRPVRAVQFPVPWTPPPDTVVVQLRRDMYPGSPPGARVVKMTWWRGRFRVYYADGEIYTEVDGSRT